MTKTITIVLAIAMVLALAACGGNDNPPATNSPSEINTPADDSADNSTDDLADDSAEDLADEPAENSADESSGNLASTLADVDAVDASPYNTKDNAVPLGQWVYYQDKNFESGEYEPFYLRIVRVSRDDTEIQRELDSYSGRRDFSLSEDQARDIEFGLVEYEIYFAPDYTAHERGILTPSVRLSATPIATAGFRTAGGMSYIGVGSTYSLEIRKSDYRSQPGDILREKGLFTVLKNYDESEYVFSVPWYDGEIVAEKARDLYFAAAQ